MAEIIRVGTLELRFLQSKDDTGGSLDLFEMVVPPEGEMPIPHYHRDWDESVYGLSGALTFTAAGVAHAIRPGDHLFIPRGTVHGFTNPSGFTAVVLSVLTPGVLGPGYFRELGALIAAGNPDPAKAEEIMRRHGLIPA